MNVVMFWFMPDWGLYGRAYEKIAEQLARQPEVGRVVCVLPPVDGESGAWHWPLSVVHASRGLVVLAQRTRVAAPGGHGYRLRRWLNSNAPDLFLRALLRLLGFRRSNTLLWLYPPHPYIEKLQRVIPHCAKVVQIVDNNALQEAGSKKYTNNSARQYEQLVRSADCVVVSSAANKQAFSHLSRDCLLFENAVDAAFIGLPSSLPCRDGSSRPRLGYVGWITERTDLTLVEQLARARPQYDIVLAGPDKVGGFAGLLGLPNVQWIGQVPYAELPQLLASFDVCLIPHKDTPYSRSMSPLKLFQYLGSGRPIVSTEVAGVDRWRHLIAVADTYEAFVSSVDDVLHNDTLREATARIDAAKRETWDVRVGAMYRAVMQSISTPKPGRP